MKKRCFRLIVTYVLLLSMLLNPLAVKANKDEIIKSSIDARIRVVQEQLNRLDKSEVGVLYQLNYLLEYHMYVRYVHSGVLNYNEQEKNIHLSYLIDAIGEFNKAYSENSTAENIEDYGWYVPIKLKRTKDYAKLYDNVSDIIPKYLKYVMDEVFGKKDNDTVRKIIKSVYNCIDTYTRTSSYLSSVSNDKDLSDNDKKIDEKIEKSFSEILTEYKNEFSKIQKNSTDNSSDNLADQINIDLSKHPVELFSNAVMRNNKIQIPEEALLSDIYLQILASSSTYTPFKSYVGSDEFISSLNNLSNNDDIISLYNDTKNLRKPLYKRKLDQNGNPTGIARIVTLQDFIDSVLKNEPCVFVTIKGTFSYDDKTSTWAYFQDDEKSGEGVRKSSGAELSTGDSSTGESTEESTEGGTEDDSTVESTGGSTDVSSVTNKIPLLSVQVPSLLTKINTEHKNEDTSNNNLNIDSSIGDEALKDNNDSKPWTVLLTKVNDGEKETLYGSKDSIKAIRGVLSRLIDNNDNFVKNISLDTFDTTFSQVTKFDEKTISDKFNEYYNSCNSGKEKDYWNEFKEKVKDKVPIDKLTGNKESINEIKKGLELLIVDKDNFVDGVSLDEFDTTFSKITEFDEKTISDKFNEYISSFKNNTEDGEKQDIDLKDDTDGDVEENFIDNIVKSSIYAYEEVTETTRMTEPVLFLGTAFQRSTDNMTSAILNNIIKSVIDLESIKDKESRFIYVNAYGDIVMDDNLVVLPGIVNPVMFKKDKKYNPYTVAVMNSYPKLLNPLSSKFELVDKNDVGKYFFMAEPEDRYFNPNNISETYCLYKTTSLFNLTKNKLMCRSLDLKFQYGVNASDKTYPFMYKNYLYTFDNNFTTDGILPLSQINKVIVDGKSLFPYNVDDDVNHTLAKVIAIAMYSNLKESTKLNDNYILHNILLTGCDGTTSPVAYQKNATMQYDMFVKNSKNRFENLLYSTSKKMADSMVDIDGVIGIKNPLSVKYIGDCIRFAQDNIIMIYLLILIFTIIGFVSRSKDILQSIIVGAFSVFITYIFICVMPSFSTYIFNTFSNNITSNISYKILSAKYESLGDNYNSTDSLGRLNMDTESITLYKYGLSNTKNVCEQYNITREDTTGGNRFVINENSGMFVENDSLKMSTTELFRTLKIKGEYVDDGVNYKYKLKSYKTESNNLDYYTPYYDFADCFIGKLNKLSEAFNMPKITNIYKDGKRKESFLVYNYINSPVFLTPGEYDYNYNVEFEKAVGTSEEELARIISFDQEYMNKLELLFGDDKDWLGISDIFTSIPDNYKNTIWANTMRVQGFYDENWNPNKHKISELLQYVNNTTRKFIIDTKDQCRQMSDENLVKIISLRAIMAFNQKVSDYGNMLYPLFLNYEEISLRDILLVAYTDNMTKFIRMDSDICKYVNAEYGWLALVLLDTSIVLIYAIVLIFNITFPVLYLLLGVLLLLKFFNYSNVKPVINGYLKSTTILFLTFSLFCFSFILVDKIDKSFLTVFITFFVSVLTLYILFIVLTSILFNITELGNTAIDARVSDFVNSPINLTKVTNMRVDRFEDYQQSDDIYWNNEYSPLDEYNFSNDINNTFRR